MLNSKKILVVVDEQHGFNDGSLRNEEALKILPNVKNKISKYRELGYTIIFTRDTHKENYLETMEGKYLPVIHCIENTDDWELMEGLTEKGDYIINKPNFGYSRWKETISEILNGEEPDEIELIGICTDICVVSNAILLKTFYPEIEIYVDESCCAGVTVETHKAAIETMKMCQINIKGENM